MAARTILSSNDHLALFGQITYATINRLDIPNICTNGEHAVTKSSSQNRSLGHTILLAATRPGNLRFGLASPTAHNSAFINVLCLARNFAPVNLYRIHICTLNRHTHQYLSLSSPYSQMKLNVANPATGAQKSFDIQDERLVRCFYEKRMSQDVEVDSLGEEWKGYVLRIGGGNDKQGFPMKQGVLLPNRVRLLLSKGDSCYRPRRTGERKRKSVRGCIVGSDIQALHLIVVKQGEKEIPGLTDPESAVPKRLGPKRANHIRKFFNLSKEDDVRQFVVRREVVSKKEGAKPYTKAPKIQRLVTAQRLQRKRHLRSLKIRRAEHQKIQKEEYEQVLAKRVAEKKQEVAAHKAARKAAKKVQA